MLGIGGSGTIEGCGIRLGSVRPRSAYCRRRCHLSVHDGVVARPQLHDKVPPQRASALNKCYIYSCASSSKIPVQGPEVDVPWATRWMVPKSRKETEVEAFEEQDS